MASRAPRDVDLCVFGATGFTGIEVAKRVHALVASGDWKVRWAVGGRSESRLRALCDREGLEPSAVLIADVDDARSLSALGARCRLVLNCTGPCRFYGDAVVTACIRAGTDYIDLCGEPEFIDRCLLTHGEAAAAAGVLVVHSCAFDSVPADIGAIFTAMQFAPPARCAHVEIFHTFSAAPGVPGAYAHATTFRAAVHGFAGVAATRAQRKAVLAKYPARPAAIGGKLAAKAGPFWHPSLRRFAIRFPGSDAAVLRLSQLELARRGGDALNLAPQYAVYFCIRSRLWVYVVGILGAIFSELTKWRWGRALLLHAPRLFTAGAFSEEGPSRRMLEGSTFRTEIFGAGYHGASGDAAGTSAAAAPDRTVRCTVSGPEPGYVATSAMFVAVGRTILEQRAKLVHRGGVFTPGGLFGSSGTSAIGALVAELGRSGVHFAAADA